MSNVVKLTLKSKPRSRGAKTNPKAPKAPKAPDARIIEACITYAQLMAAHTATFRAAPTDEYSNRFGNASYDRAGAALRAATSKATTAAGLNSKARIIPIVVEDAEFGSFEAEQVDFLVSFAADVKAYLQPTVDDERRTALNLPKPGAPRRTGSLKGLDHDQTSK